MVPLYPSVTPCERESRCHTVTSRSPQESNRQPRSSPPPEDTRCRCTAAPCCARRCRRRQRWTAWGGHPGPRASWWSTGRAAAPRTAPPPGSRPSPGRSGACTGQPPAPTPSSSVLTSQAVKRWRLLFTCDRCVRVRAAGSGDAQTRFQFISREDQRIKTEWRKKNPSSVSHSSTVHFTKRWSVA